MPFTPFHLGAAAVVKAAADRHFSFMVFGGTQVMMDIEPGVRMLLSSPILHGPSHTLGGAILIGLVAMIVGKPISSWALRLIRYPEPNMSWLAAGSGAFFGSLSHILLDAMMHSDMRPWAPLADHNHLLGIVNLPLLHISLVLGGLIGGALFYLRYRRRTKSS